MSHSDLGPPLEPPALCRDEAIEIALSDPGTSPEMRGLPIAAEYGSPLILRWNREPYDAWKVSVNVSSLGWQMGYEGPGATRMNGEVYFPDHVRVPKVLAMVMLVHDKLGDRTPWNTEADPDGEHRIEWRRA
jgi:hypothetical protein